MGKAVDIKSVVEELEKEVHWQCDVPHFSQVINMDDIWKKQQEVNIEQNIPETVAATPLQQGKEVEIAQEIAYLKAYSFISPFRPIYSCRKIIGPLIVFVKRVIRKLTKFYVEPVVFDQNDRNAHTARALELMEAQIKAQAEEIARLREMISK